VTLGATVVPYKEVTISAQIPGQIKFIGGQEGDSFKAGDKLVAIDDADLQARRRAAVAQILAAQAALNNANVQYSSEIINPSINRQQNTTSGFGMPQMFDQMFTRPFASSMGQAKPGLQRYADVQRQINSVNQARSAMMRAQAQLQQIDVSLRDTISVAPFDGVIVSKKIEVGDSVQPGQAMMTFAYVKFLRVQAEVPVRLVSGLKKGMFVPARIDAGGGIVVKARVAQIFPIANKARHTVTVKFDLPKGVPGGPGMYAEVTIPDITSKSAPTMIIPRSALSMRGSLPSIRVLVNGKPSTRLVRIGKSDGNGNVTILSGLKGDEQVIIDGPNG
ncbi:MAG TPA: efflux RND transporter periplasmic adaptor subunit, partial [Rhizobiales bacterium]|nr:efflux RND transporter periplasmic adaptor subunit [Hyphomicrobiales bacterium]